MNLEPICFFEILVVSISCFSFLFLFGRLIRKYILEKKFSKLSFQITNFECFFIDLLIGFSSMIGLVMLFTPFGLLNELSSAIVFILVIFFSFIDIIPKKIHELKKILSDYLNNFCINWEKNIIYVILILFCMIFALVHFISIDGLFAFSEMDIKPNALTVQSIIDQGGFSIYGVVKYGDTVNYYPQGYHVLVAFFSLVLNSSPERIFTILSQLFTSVLPIYLALAAYSIFKDLRVGLFAAFAVSLPFFPMSFTWGGDTFVVGSLFLAILIFLVFKNNKLKLNPLVVGLLLGGLLSIYPLLFISFLAMYVPYLIFNQKYDFNLFSKIKSFLNVLLVSLSISCFTIYQWTLFPYLINSGFLPDLGVAKDLLNSPILVDDVTVWHKMIPGDVILDFSQSFGDIIQGLSQYYDRGDFPVIPGSPVISLIILTSFFIILLLFFALFDSNVRQMILRYFRFGIPIIVIWFSILFIFIQMNPVGLFQSSFSLISRNTDRIIFMSTWPIIMSIGLGLSISIGCIIASFKTLRIKIQNNKKILIKMQYFSNKKIASCFFLIIISLFYFVGSMSIIITGSDYRFNHYVETVQERSVLSYDDYALMHWMNSNLSSDAVIFVNSVDAGDFIPVIASKQIVYPWGYNKQSPLYLDAVDALVKDPNNKTALLSLHALNVTHIYVGAKSYYPKNQELFVADMFLCSTNYQLVKNIGQAYLFYIL